MTDEDTRSLPAVAQAALRNRAVRAVLDGMTQAEAARVFRVHPNAVNRWIKRYRQGGFPGLVAQRRGRRAGEQAALSEPQQQEVIALVRETTPDQLGLPEFLWTREAVAELIARRYRVRLARTTMGGYLRSWGFSPQKPQRRALEQTPAAVRRWLAQDYPAIRAQARREGGMVLWLDEMGVRSDAAAGRSWAPVGQTPVIKRTGKRFRVNMLSAISGAGRLRFRRVVHRSGVHRLPGPAAAGLRRAEGAPDRGRPSRPPGQGGQRLGSAAWRADPAARAARLQPGTEPGGVAQPGREGERGGEAACPLGRGARQGASVLSASPAAPASGSGPVLYAPAHLLRRPMNHPICPPR